MSSGLKTTTVRLISNHTITKENIYKIINFYGFKGQGGEGSTGDYVLDDFILEFQAIMQS